jgi:glycosyltransferase involved in cell wall biosynthesis
LDKHANQKGDVEVVMFASFRQVPNSRTYKVPGIDPLAVIRPGIDLDVFTPKPMKEPSEWGDLVLGAVGRKEPFKGTRFAMDAYKILRQEDKSRSIRVALGNVDLDDGVEIVPIASDRDLAEFYRSVDILLVACVGQHGAQHYPLIEAMASCTPVVHTGFFPGNEQNSYAAVPSDAQSLAEKVKQVIHDQHYAEKVAAARAFVEENLRWEAIAESFIEVFTTCPRTDDRS